MKHYSVIMRFYTVVLIIASSVGRLAASYVDHSRMEKVRSEVEMLHSDLVRVKNPLIQEKVKNRVSIGFKDIPGVRDIPLPPGLKRVLENVNLEDPSITYIKHVLTIEGTVNIFGNRVTGKIRDVKSKYGKDIYTFMVGVGKGFKFSKIDPVFAPLDTIEISDAVLIVSQDLYDDPEWGEIYMGVTFAGTIKVGGTVEKLTSMVGSGLNELVLKGNIAPKISGTSFTATIPGKLRFGNVAQTTGLTFGIYVVELIPGVPSGVQIGITTGLEVTIPGQKPLIFATEILGGLTKASLDGWVSGMFKFPGVPIEIGNLKAKATIDYAVAAASSGVLSVSGLGMGGEVAVGNKRVAVDLYVEVATTTEVLASGKFDGGLYLEDLVILTNNMIEIASNKKVDLYSKIKDKIPHMGINNATMYIAPKDMRFAGWLYKKGVQIKASTEILKTKVGISAFMGEKGLYMTGSMGRTKVGPLTIMGIGSDDAHVRVVVDPFSKDILAAYIDGRIALDFLDGISAETRIDFRPTSLDFSVDMSLLNRFQVVVQAEIDLRNPLAGLMSIEFTQAGLTALRDLLRQGSAELLKSREKIKEAQEKAKRDLEAAHRNLQRIKDTISELEDLKRRLDAATKACV